MMHPPPPPPPPPPAAHMTRPAPATCNPDDPINISVDTIVTNAAKKTFTATLDQYPQEANSCVTMSGNDIVLIHTKNDVVMNFYLLNTPLIMSKNAITPKFFLDGEFSTPSISGAKASIYYADTASQMPHYYSIKIQDTSKKPTVYTYDPKIQNQPPQSHGLETLLVFIAGIAVGGALALFGVYFVRLFRRRG